MHTRYRNPVTYDYADHTIEFLFSEENTCRTWRKIWAALAEAQFELGVLTEYESIRELNAFIDRIDFDRAAELELYSKNTLAAHRQAYAEQCGNCDSMIQLGVPDQFVYDNAHLIVVYKALEVIDQQIIGIAQELARIAKKLALIPVADVCRKGPGNGESLGTRITYWIQDLNIDLNMIDTIQAKYRLCSLETDDIANSSVQNAVERRTLHLLGFSSTYRLPDSYPRKLDRVVQDVLSSIADSCVRFASELRVLCSYCDDVRSERIADTIATPDGVGFAEYMLSMSRLVASTVRATASAELGHMSDGRVGDSIIRSVVMPEAFMSVSCLLGMYLEAIISLEEVFAQVDRRQYLFDIARDILEEAVRNGGCEEALVTRLYSYCITAASHEEESASRAVFLKHISEDPDFGMTAAKLETRLLGSEASVARFELINGFLSNEVEPILHRKTAQAAKEARILASYPRFAYYPCRQSDKDKEST